jgi:hypothetical protein
MPDKPSYLGLLNAISNAEAAAQGHFEAWAAVTPDPELREVLHLVAIREGEHALSFEKRIIGLGFTLRHRPDPESETIMACLSDPELSDMAKLEHRGYDKPATVPDIFDPMFQDHTIDIETGGLLGRYIAEERDTGRRLRAEYQRLKALRKKKSRSAA